MPWLPMQPTVPLIEYSNIPDDECCEEELEKRRAASSFQCSPMLAECLANQQTWGDPVSATVLRYAQEKLANVQAPPLAITWHTSDQIDDFSTSGKRNRDEESNFAKANMERDGAAWDTTGSRPAKRIHTEGASFPNQWSPIVAPESGHSVGRKRCRDDPRVEFLGIGRRLDM